MHTQKSNILIPHNSTRNMRPQLERGCDYMQQNVNNQTQFYQIRLAYVEQPNTKTLHMFTLT
jgi:hypothetical protein